MDVNYITSDWEKAKQSVGSLIGNGWGRGMFDDLRKLTNNLEDVESLIRKYDSDGYISFHHTSQEKKYQQLFNDYQELHRFTKQVGGIVDDVIDQRFYEDMDAFVEAMRNLRIEEYTTENRIDATTIIHTHHAPGGSVELPKDEITLNDLFAGDNFYANQIKLEYQQVKEMNPDQEFSLEDYQLAALNTHAFEYESIKDQQYNKEFWAGLAALVVIVGATLIFPPAGIALAAIYGTLEITTMVSGKDWVSGRELEPGERWFRGLLAPLDIIPGVSGAKRLVTVGRVNRLHTLTDIGIQTKKLGTSIKNTIGNTVDIARTEGLKRLNQAKEFSVARAKGLGRKLEKDIIEVARLADHGITAAKRVNEFLFGKNYALAGMPKGFMSSTVENSHKIEKLTQSKIDTFKISVKSGVDGKGISNIKFEVPPAFRQTEFASSYEARIHQTPSPVNTKVEFDGIRGESLCIPKPPPDPDLKRILDEAGIKGIQYKNGVPDFLSVAKAQVEINYMLGGKGIYGGKARRANFTQSDQRLAEQLNNSPKLARQFGMESGTISARDIKKYRERNNFTWHELNDVKTMQLVPTKINSEFGHLGGVGEINAGAFGPGGFASKQRKENIK